jgi:hypothetical protein
VLQFEYDSVIGKLKITKNKIKMCEKDIEKNATSDYAFYAFLRSSGDSVQLIN